MLTPAQKKVRQELEELQINGRLHQHENNLPQPIEHSQTNTTSNFRYIVITVILVSCLIVVISLLNSKMTENHQDILNYLSKAQALNNQSERMMDDHIDNIHMEFSRKAHSELEAIKLKQAELLLQAMDLKAPASFKDHQDDFIKEMDQRLTIFTLLEANPANRTQLNKYLIELRIKQELQRESLLLALERANIKHAQEADGTIKYWINDDTFQYK
jgi:Arm DNA-binding domain